MSEEMTMAAMRLWLIGYSALTLLIMAGTLSAYIKFKAKIPPALIKVLAAIGVIGIAIVIHAAATFEFVSGNAQIIDLVISHAILFVSLAVLAIYARKLKMYESTR